MHEESSQVAVSTFTDAQQFLLAASRVLPRYQSQPGGERTALRELCSAADRCHNGSRCHRSDTGNRHQAATVFALARRPRDHRVGFIDPALQLPQFTLQLCQQHAQMPGQAVLRIFQDAEQRSFGMSATLPKRDTAPQQQSANLVDHRRLCPTQRSRTRCRDCIFS